VAILRTVGLGKDYGALTAVHALDLEVEEGEIFGLLGPNGAGKTTAISMICGVLTPTRGTAAIGGHDVRAERFPAQRLLGLAPQEVALYEELSAKQNLRFFGRLYGLRGDVLADRIAWVLDVVGLAGRADEPVARYSGGMKRRLNMAAGLLHRPRLLVLDEPTVGVDPQSRAHIFETVRRLRDEHDATVLYTSHYMEEVEALCTRVGILDQGKLVALDTVADLVARHADGALEVEVDGDAALAAEALAHHGRATASGARVRLHGTVALAEAVRTLETAGVRVVSASRHRPNLETVFLALTGRRLRDEP
jgi:ABC-2 type transport system ATP-binding protein